MHPMSTGDTEAVVADADRLPGRMTEQQYVAWAIRSELRSEWVNGEVRLMNAVEIGHVDWGWFLVELLRRFARQARLGKVLGEPYQVRLPGSGHRRQPDVFFVRTANRHLLRRMEFDGVPDLIVEVVSPDNQVRDRREKFAEYESAGVPEYWLPDPVLRTFEGYALGPDGRYARLPEREGRVASTVLAGAHFRPDWLRLFEPPEVDALLAEMVSERTRLLGSSPPPPASDNDR